MKNNNQIIALLYRTGSTLAVSLALLIPQLSFAQPPRAPFSIEPDPRVQQLSYHFEETGEEMPYVLYVSSKVSNEKQNPLVVALHGFGGDGNFLLRERLVDMAEEGGYIVVAPMGYNVSGWYGSPLIVFGDEPVEPANLTELSEMDVMNVLAMMREQFNVDEDRTYLMGHSMGGAGTLFLGAKHTSNWAAIAAIAPAAFMMEDYREEILGTVQDAEIPVMVVQGDMDAVVPLENTILWVESMREMGMNHEYLELSGGDHGSIIGDGMSDIFRFFGEYTKNP